MAVFFYKAGNKSADNKRLNREIKAYEKEQKIIKRNANLTRQQLLNKLQSLSKK